MILAPIISNQVKVWKNSRRRRVFSNSAGMVDLFGRTRAIICWQSSVGRSLRVGPEGLAMAMALTFSISGSPNRLLKVFVDSITKSDGQAKTLSLFLIPVSLTFDSAWDPLRELCTVNALSIECG